MISSLAPALVTGLYLFFLSLNYELLEPLIYRAMTCIGTYKFTCDYRTLEVPSSRIVIIEGIYALSEKLRPLLDLRVSVTGGVHFDLVKRVLRDIQRVGQEPEEIIYQISETVCSCSSMCSIGTGT